MFLKIILGYLIRNYYFHSKLDRKPFFLISKHITQIISSRLAVLATASSPALWDSLWFTDFMAVTESGSRINSDRNVTTFACPNLCCGLPTAGQAPCLKSIFPAFGGTWWGPWRHSHPSQMGTHRRLQAVTRLICSICSGSTNWQLGKFLSEGNFLSVALLILGLDLEGTNS